MNEYLEALKKLHDRGLYFGDVVKHFKRETIREPKNFNYLYTIVGIGKHTETGEYLVLYRALYGDNPVIYCRPIDMFLSEVDHEKYSYINQRYRLEKYEYNPDDFKPLVDSVNMEIIKELVPELYEKIIHYTMMDHTKDPLVNINKGE